MTQRPLLPDALALMFNSIVRATADATIQPGVAAEWIQAIEQYVRNYGKLSKFAAVYTPVQPPPLAWRYS